MNQKIWYVPHVNPRVTQQSLQNDHTVIEFATEKSDFKKPVDSKTVLQQ